MISYGRQSISDSDIKSVVDVLRSDYLTQGEVGYKFEDAVCKYTGAKYATSTNSGTSALHLACLALQLGKGDVLWTSSITFVASANCGLYCGADIDFIDIDRNSWNLSIKSLRTKLEEAEKSNKLPKIVVVVHLCGLPCEMEDIYFLSKKYGFFVIEDASHAIGSKYKDNLIGNCEYSDITIFSFHPVKTITTGEGGMAVTNSEKLSERMKLLRSHGITKDPNLMTKKMDGPWYYQQIDLGFNYRMTDIQAALGCSQIQRLSYFVSKRNEIADRYDRELSKLPLTLPMRRADVVSSFHLYVVRIILRKSRRTHREVIEYLLSMGIGVNVHYIPLHTQPYYIKNGYCVNQYKEADLYYSEAISLPIFPDLSIEDQMYVVKCLSDAVV